MADEEIKDDRPVDYVANPVKDVREREHQAAKDLEAGLRRTPDPAAEQQRLDKKAWDDAAVAHKENLRNAKIQRNKDAEKLEIGPNHPLHPRNASNPSNPTSPVTHDPSIMAQTDNLGEGEP